MGNKVWEKITIGQLIKEGAILVHKDGNHGSNYPRGNEFGDEGVPFLTAKLLSDSGTIDLLSAPRLNYEKARKIKFGYIQEGDVLLSHNATVGRVAVVPSLKEDVLIGTSLTHFRLDSTRLLPKYLAAYFKGRDFQNQLSAFMGGMSTRNQVPITAQKCLEVVVPPMNEQKRIAKVLESLDEKIELNRQTNQTLEQMAQALFKSWFVDFDPVIDNALAAGNDIPEALQHKAEKRKQAQQLPDFKPLPDNIRALFPSEFEQTDEPTVGFTGWIPKGWSAGNLSSLTKFTSNRIDGTELTLDNYISTDNMLSNKGGVSTASKVPDIKTTPSFKPGDILISNIRPYFQKIWFATFSGGRSNDVLGFEAIDEQCKEYLLNLLYQDVFFDYMMTTSKGSKMPRGDKKAIMDWPVVIPPSSLQKFFSEHVKNYYQVIPIRNKERESLSQLRDILLPKLISGEITLNKEVA